MRGRALVSIVALSALTACGSRGTWEPQSEAAARYGSWTDESLLLESMQRAVGELVEAHPPANVKAVAIRMPRDPDGYAAAALLADAYEKGGAAVAWIPFDAAKAPNMAEIWEVATTIRGAVTTYEGGEPAYRRLGHVEVRISSIDSRDARLLWNAKGNGKAYCAVNVRFPGRKVIPDDAK